MNQLLTTPITQNLEKFNSEFDKIPLERKQLLERLSAYVAQKLALNQPIKIIVICTHNSRRSHIGQLWLQASAIHLGIPNFESYSGGTEATAFNTRSVAAMERVGFIFDKTSEGENPIYHTFMPTNAETPTVLFSKKFDADSNPQQNFAAIMVCTEADQGCPIVPGTDLRLAIPFEDPKAFDDTDLEALKYDERVQQIGLEFLYALKTAKELGSPPN